MPTSKKPRKKFRPKNFHFGAVVNPVRYAQESVRPPDQKFVDKLRLQELGAIEEFAKGRGSMEEWEILARMVNISQHLGAHGCGAEALPACSRSAEGLMASIERAKNTGRLGFDGPTLTALREVREYMDLQFQSLTVKELEGHFAAVRREQDRLRRTA